MLKEKWQIIRFTWKAMKPVDKVKVVLNILGSAGVGIAMASVGEKLGKDRSIPAKICVFAATSGLTGALTTVAIDGLDEEVDDIANFIEKRKAQKKMKEAEADGRK